MKKMTGKIQKVNMNKSFAECLNEKMAILNHTKGKDAFGRDVRR